MQKKNFKKAVIFVTFFSTLLIVSSPNVNAAADKVLKPGTRGEQVQMLQKNLKTLGMLKASATGYYGIKTKSAVVQFQKKNRLKIDGIAGKKTLELLERFMQKNPKAPEVRKFSSLASRGDGERNTYLLPWFGVVENLLTRGKTATVLDIHSGLEFQMKRTFGYNHADCETLTKKDTEIMKEIYQGNWSWERRPVIVTVDGKSIAGSMAGMPHAGIDSAPSVLKVSWRSSGYGPGENLDAVKGNDMDGHFDIHFLGSKTHGSNRIDDNHQQTLRMAAEWALTNRRLS